MVETKNNLDWVDAVWKLLEGSLTEEEEIEYFLRMKTVKPSLAWEKFRALNEELRQEWRKFLRKVGN